MLLFQVAGLAKLRLGQLERRAKKEALGGAKTQRVAAPKASFAPVEELLRQLVEEGSSALREGHPAATVEYWESLAGGELTVGRPLSSLPSSVDAASWCELELESCRSSLDEGGYMEWSGGNWESLGIDLATIATTMRSLKAAGWPPVFIFL